MQPETMIDKQIGPYLVQSKLGQGGVGAVYLAKDTRSGLHVAVKMLHDRLTGHERARSRFVREAEVLARLKHPRIVQVLDFLQLPEGFFIILEFARGETLESGLQRLGPFDWSNCVEWFCEALDALDYAHQQGVIHRDVKPGNMIVQMDGKLKMLDFGMAKLSDAEKQLTAPGMTLGTIAYMSREQLLGKKLDPRSDFYSLGVSLYEIVTGRLPFWSEVDRELAMKIVKEEARPPSEFSKKLPSAADPVILKALMKKPKDRYQTAAEFRDALRGSL